MQIEIPSQIAQGCLREAHCGDWEEEGKNKGSHEAEAGLVVVLQEQELLKDTS